MPLPPLSTVHVSPRSSERSIADVGGSFLPTAANTVGTEPFAPETGATNRGNAPRAEGVGPARSTLRDRQFWPPSSEMKKPWVSPPATSRPDGSWATTVMNPAPLIGPLTKPSGAAAGGVQGPPAGARGDPPAADAPGPSCRVATRAVTAAKPAAVNRRRPRRRPPGFRRVLPQPTPPHPPSSGAGAVPATSLPASRRATPARSVRLQQYGPFGLPGEGRVRHRLGPRHVDCFGAGRRIGRARRVGGAGRIGRDRIGGRVGRRCSRADAGARRSPFTAGEGARRPDRLAEGRPAQAEPDGTHHRNDGDEGDRSLGSPCSPHHTRCSHHPCAAARCDRPDPSLPESGRSV